MRDNVLKLSTSVLTERLALLAPLNEIAVTGECALFLDIRLEVEIASTVFFVRLLCSAESALGDRGCSTVEQSEHLRSHALRQRLLLGASRRRGRRRSECFD